MNRTGKVEPRRTEALGAAEAERQRMAARLHVQQAEVEHLGRLSLLGEVAGTLAHELNQPLASIANYADSLPRRAASQGQKRWNRISGLS